MSKLLAKVSSLRLPAQLRASGASSAPHVQIKYGIGGKTEGTAVIGNGRFARMVSTTHQSPPGRTPTVGKLVPGLIHHRWVPFRLRDNIHFFHCLEY